MFMPYSTAITFIESKKSWIRKHLVKQVEIGHGSYIGKMHQISVSKHNKADVKTRVSNNVIYISIPSGSRVSDQTVQEKIRKAAHRALKIELQSIIIPRLQDISYEFSLPFNDVHVKTMKSRWGSCDSKRNITLNTYLPQLDWELINYVLTHELVHTIEMNHSAAFWKKVGEIIPEYKELRKRLKTMHPLVYEQ